MAHRTPKFIVYALLCLLALSASAYAHQAVDDPLARTAVFNIEAQPLSNALIEFSRQAGLQVLTPAGRVQKLTTRGVHGRMTVSEALNALLQGTRLRYHLAGANTIGIDAEPEVQSSLPRVGSESLASAETPVGSHTGKVNQARSTISPEATSKLSEVVVTAQKFTQRAFDVPISLAVISGAELNANFVRSMDDLTAIVPGLSVVDTGTGLRIAIRGISNVEGQGALVGSYLDDADVTTEENLAINLYTYDLQRIEVLRGPQGTLYGEGSIGGTIRYITNKPSVNQVQLSTDVTATFDQYGAPGEQIIAVANAPLISDRIALRIAADLDHEGGWMDQPITNQKNVNGRDVADVRMEGLWRLSDDFTVNAMQVIHAATSGPFVGESTPGVYTQVFNLPTTAGIADAYHLSNLTLHWSGSQVQALDSLTYFKHDLKQVNSGFVFPLTPPPSPAYDEYIPQVRTVDQSLSDEVHVGSSSEGALHWIVGGFYRNFTDTAPPYVYYFDLPGPPGSGLPAPYPSPSQSVQSKSVSVFGDVSYQLFGRLTMGAGVRHFKDDEHYLLSGTPTQAGTFTSTDPRFYLQYGISPNINLYTSAAKGFRSGGFNGYPFQPYGPENVWTYELGSKMRFAHQAVSADSDVFWSNYNGYQNVGLLPPPASDTSYITRNAGTARIKGIEGDLTWIPVSGVKFGLTADYTDARYVQINLLETSYEVGDPLDMVPRYQFTASGEEDVSWNGKASFTRMEYSQVAPETFRDRSLGDFYYGESDYIYLLNFRAGIQWTQALRISAFAQNLLNDRGYTGPFVIEDNASREQPRTLGLEFDYTLD